MLRFEQLCALNSAARTDASASNSNDKRREDAGRRSDRRPTTDDSHGHHANERTVPNHRRRVAYRLIDNGSDPASVRK